ncbi:hypothetical protein [Lyngbya aestuarii]|uniref:hypothetical protein n=1 Tax=Lyngbya aestuarii TaxID=118322 RepID=UPI00403DC175
MNNQTLKPNQDKGSQKHSKGSWWEKLVAVIALINLVLVLFNLSYIPLRDIYLRQFPAVVSLYDPIKGIEPHPDTKRYLNTVDTLAKQLPNQGLQTPETSQLLASVRQQSADLIAENPFLAANKFGTFAKLKRRMQYHLETESAKQAFALFWSEDYLTQVGPEAALSFFESKIRPLLATNYFRYVDENGQLVDEFWRIDIYFIIFFALEFFSRTFFMSTSKSGVSWWDAMLRRWYDGLLLLPTWRWLRVIPVSVRLHQSGLINLELILAQVTHEPAAYLADRVSLFLMVRLLNQTQEAINSKDAARLLFESGDYVKVSDTNKIDAITDRILQLAIYKVLPQVQPDLEALLHHSLKGALAQSDLYQGLQQVPGIKGLPKEATEQLANYLAQATYEVLATSYSDTQGRVLFERLTQDFKQALRLELQDEATQSELQLLLSELLEEVKLNYVQRSQEEDPEETMTEAEQLRQVVEN